MKVYTQAQLDAMIDTEMHHLICLVANDVNDTLDMKRTLNAQIKEIMRNNGLTEGLMLRRDYDGVTEANWMVRKMIGELLAFGRARI